MMLACIRTGRLFRPDGVPKDTSGLLLVPIEEAEPHYEQSARSASSPRDRTEDGRYDRSHLSPEHAYRMGRDYLAHCLRYGWPMKFVRENVGPGGRILEVGCGKEIPFFRALTCDHSAMKHYKPLLFVGADLNRIKYRPEVTGIRTVLLDESNVIDDPSRVPDEPFDLVVSFEVIEHMGKEDGERFLDSLMAFARRRGEREGRPAHVLLSTPVNDGFIAKNHVYEWRESELERAFTKRGGVIEAKFGTFANLVRLAKALTDEQRRVWNDLSQYHGPHTLSCVFAALHPSESRNIAWQVRVPA